MDRDALRGDESVYARAWGVDVGGYLVRAAQPAASSFIDLALGDQFSGTLSDVLDQLVTYYRGTTHALYVRKRGRTPPEISVRTSADSLASANREGLVAETKDCGCVDLKDRSQAVVVDLDYLKIHAGNSQALAAKLVHELRAFAIRFSGLAKGESFSFEGSNGSLVGIGALVMAGPYVPEEPSAEVREALARSLRSLCKPNPADVARRSLLREQIDAIGGRGKIAVADQAE